MQQENKKPRSHEEDQLQTAVVEYLAWSYPDLLFFAVPNGAHMPDFTTKNGDRISLEAIKMKRMGLKPGVADLLLFTEFDKIAVELKSAKGYQSPNQKKFQIAWEEKGGKYFLCRSLDQVDTALKSCHLKPKYQAPAVNIEVKRQMHQMAWIEAQRPL